MKSKLLLTKDSILDLALGLGYESEAAFSRAYKKLMAQAPSHTKKFSLAASNTVN